MGYVCVCHFLRSGTAQLWVLLSRADRDRRADWSEWSWRLHFTELVCVNESVDWLIDVVQPPSRAEARQAPGP